MMYVDVDILLDSLSGQFVADLINCGMSTASNHFFESKFIDSNLICVLFCKWQSGGGPGQYEISSLE
jgi:hypothetical protein